MELVAGSECGRREWEGDERGQRQRERVDGLGQQLGQQFWQRREHVDESDGRGKLRNVGAACDMAVNHAAQWAPAPLA